jgi:hypothetical protein
LPVEAVDLRMPEGAGFVWVDIQQRALTDPSCPGAVLIPFIHGTEPQKSTKCMQKQQGKDKKSLWRKWFDGKD